MIKHSLQKKYLILHGLSAAISIGALALFFYASNHGFKNLVSISAKNMDALYSTSEIKSLLSKELLDWNEFTQQQATEKEFNKSEAAVNKAATFFAANLPAYLQGPDKDFINAHDQIMRQANSKEQGATKSPNSMHNLYRSAYKSLNDFSDLVLLSIQDQQVQSIQKSNRILKLSAILILGVLSLLLFFSFYYVRKKIIAPILKITSASLNVASGLFNEIPVDSRDEIGLLAQNFNHMVRELRANAANRENIIHLGRDISSQDTLSSISSSIYKAAITLSDPKIETSVYFSFHCFSKVQDVENYCLLKDGSDEASEKYCKFSEFENLVGQKLYIYDSRSTECLAVIVIQHSVVHVADTALPSLRALGNSIASAINTVRMENTLKLLRESQGIITAQQQSLAASAKMSALGEMSGGVAHEINNPLATMQIVTEQLLDSLDNEPLNKEELKSMASKTLAQVIRIAKIVKGLRTFSRDASRDPFSTVELSTLIENTTSLCRERMQNHNVKLTFDEVAAGLAFEGREVEISQVLLNLLNNAHDAVEKLSSRWVKISAKTSGDFLEIRITDSGSGIPKDVAQKLFQPFFTTKEIGKGTGLGLSVSLGLIKAHHGELLIDHEAKNTTFVIRLPQKQKLAA